MLRLKKLYCTIFTHDWFMRFFFKNSEMVHRKCKRCEKLQRHAGLNYWVSLEQG